MVKKTRQRSPISYCLLGVCSRKSYNEKSGLNVQLPICITPVFKVLHLSYCIVYSMMDILGAQSNIKHRFVLTVYPHALFPKAVV